MVQNYLAAISELEENPELTLDEVVSRHNSHIKWDGDLKKKLGQGRETEFEDKYIRKIVYRPFIATDCYADDIFIQRKGQMGQILPNSSIENRVICVPNKGSRNSFSVLMTNIMPDRHFIEAAHCFPRWQYPQPAETSNKVSEFQGFDPVLDRIDNISDTALHAFCAHYGIKKITKDEIFNYVYGILHAPSYREQFASDLSKMIPRIPFAPDFLAFTEAGQRLADLHLNYETCRQYPNLNVEPLKPSLLWEEKPEHFLLGKRAMRFADKQERTTLIINEHVCISGIPEEAHQYVVNGRTPLEWFIDRYKIKQDKNSGIINDPNGWFDNPRDLITAIERIVYVSVESTKIIENLPSQITDD